MLIKSWEMVEYSEESRWGVGGWQMAWHELSCFLDGVGFVDLGPLHSGPGGEREGGGELLWVCPQGALAWFS